MAWKASAAALAWAAAAALLTGCAQSPAPAGTAAPSAAANVPRTGEADAGLMQAAQAEQAAVMATLERLVNIETGTGNAEGLATMAQVLERELRAVGATVTRHKPEGSVVGDNLVARIPGKGATRLLLIAHMDTVYVKGTLARRPFHVAGGRAYGPGIADDKGGIAVILHALRLLKARGVTDHGPITVLFNSDEERGSFGSRALIQRLASEADAVLSFEPTSVQAESVLLGTSGIVYYRVAVQGAPAHAGGNPEMGVNALVEAADIVGRTRDLDNPARDLRLNWTVMNAGAVPNVVPDQARLDADIRYAREDDLKSLLDGLEDRIQNQKKLGKAQNTISIQRGRPPFTANAGGRSMGATAVAIYAELGHTLTVVERTGGGTDAAYAALSGKPVIESMGLPGYGYHSDQAEYVLVDAIPRRLYLTARMIMELSKRKP